MEWAVLYQTEGSFEEIVGLLRQGGYSPQVFCDPHCRHLYVPGGDTSSVKCPPQYFVAVPRDQRFNAQRIVNQWIKEYRKKTAQLKMNVLGKALKATFYTLAAVFVYQIARPFLGLTEISLNETERLIFVSIALWTAIFIYLITKKPASPRDKRDFTTHD